MTLPGSNSGSCWRHSHLSCHCHCLLIPIIAHLVHIGAHVLLRLEHTRNPPESLENVIALPLQLHCWSTHVGQVVVSNDKSHDKFKVRNGLGRQYKELWEAFSLHFQDIDPWLLLIVKKILGLKGVCSNPSNPPSYRPVNILSVCVEMFTISGSVIVGFEKAEYLYTTAMNIAPPWVLTFSWWFSSQHPVIVTFLQQLLVLPQ